MPQQVQAVRAGPLESGCAEVLVLVGFPPLLGGRPSSSARVEEHKVEGKILTTM